VAGWIKICEVTKEKLDRDLTDKEIDFLKWVSKKHEIEKNGKTYAQNGT